MYHPATGTLQKPASSPICLGYAHGVVPIVRAAVRVVETLHHAEPLIGALMTRDAFSPAVPGCERTSLASGVFRVQADVSGKQPFLLSSAIRRSARCAVNGNRRCYREVRLPALFAVPFMAGVMRRTV